MASQLKGYGVTVNFGLVLDTFNMDDLDNMIRKWERSFGSHKIIREVAPFFIESHWEEGVIPCAKHFPDCGTIVDSTDSHEKATRSILIEEFKETYKHVVANVDVPMVMTTHNIVIGDESELPATFSPYVLSILRNEIGFGECIITDDLTMGSIRGETLKATIDQGTEEVFLGHNGYSMRDILTRSLNAGHDLLLFKNLSQFKGDNGGFRDFTPEEVVNIIYEQVETGEIDRQRILESYERVEALKGRIN
ncbi:uncharacterized protein LOC111320275 [Stylophora pistillata]|uniref:uncharacterized protein LOC111320275 n=1 Tax=Stylophora pistillata TaxID=50429 RepID=UPI000C044092|nr:uncharacterized protein LOC111320275 [Stylophora pistillata]